MLSKHTRNQTQKFHICYKMYKLFMSRKNESLKELLFELIKNSKRSDRDLAKILGYSQASITRKRKILEKEAIKQYTVIPNLSYLGFDIVAFTFASAKLTMDQPLETEGRKWADAQPNIVFSSTGQGMGADGLMVSVHKDYADFAKFNYNFMRSWGKYFQDIKTFLISIKGDLITKSFSFNYLTKTGQKETLK